MVAMLRGARTPTPERNFHFALPLGTRHAFQALLAGEAADGSRRRSSLPRMMPAIIIRTTSTAPGAAMAPSTPPKTCSNTAMTDVACCPAAGFETLGMSAKKAAASSQIMAQKPATLTAWRVQ
ncbi:hypothetical protein AHiyo6_35070 [Arthrobacter sp. Hiyo6]|nr:hypothetical protein AHiyo6_35070 [Arthrobacter sp. Hiyo6]